MKDVEIKKHEGDEQKIDIGHAHLIHDIKCLLDMAERFEFHDFKNTQFGAPKMALRVFFLEGAEKAKNGYYDN